LIQSRLGQAEQARKELSAFVQSIPLSEAHDWQASIAQFLLGNLDDQEFLNEATTKAVRPTDVSPQICDAYYYAGMKHLLAGDKAGAAELFQKSLDTGQDDESEYKSAHAELSVLKKAVNADGG
jgi:lipoprotein NlpI